MLASIKFLEALNNNKEVVTIGLAFVGIMAAYITARMHARNKDRLELVNRQLSELYGPLYMASQAGEIAYKELLQKYGRKKDFFEEGHENPPQKELDEWIVWVKNIFLPLNDLREKIIIEQAHLIIENSAPRCLLDFVTHVVGYKAILVRWEKGDFSEKWSIKDFPRDLTEYAENSYHDLKKQQARLLNSLLSAGMKSV